MDTSSDRWVAGAAYEKFMGRWSRHVARRFLDWLERPPGLRWLDVGCGTGALAEAIRRHARPRTLVACDPSAEFVGFARASSAACSATFVVTSADHLPVRGGAFDVVVSGLVLNFLPQPPSAVESMKNTLTPGGVLAAYVWDYAEGMQWLRVFWEEAAVVDPMAEDRDEARRFPLCHPDRLADLWRGAGMAAVATTSLQIDSVFASFDDFWTPFLAGTGPAPSYVAGLDPAVRARLARRLQRRLSPSADGSIHLTARAYGVHGVWSPDRT